MYNFSDIILKKKSRCADKITISLENSKARTTERKSGNAKNTEQKYDDKVYILTFIYID